MVSRISFFTSCSPPTSCQDTEGIWETSGQGGARRGSSGPTSQALESHPGCSHSLGVSCLQLV